MSKKISQHVDTSDAPMDELSRLRQENEALKSQLSDALQKLDAVRDIVASSSAASPYPRHPASSSSSSAPKISWNATNIYFDVKFSSLDMGTELNKETFQLTLFFDGHATIGKSCSIGKFDDQNGDFHISYLSQGLQAPQVLIKEKRVLLGYTTRGWATLDQDPVCGEIRRQVDIFSSADKHNETTKIGSVCVVMRGRRVKLHEWPDLLESPKQTLLSSVTSVAFNVFPTVMSIRDVAKVLQIAKKTYQDSFQAVSDTEATLSKALTVGVGTSQVRSITFKLNATIVRTEYATALRVVTNNSSDRIVAYRWRKLIRGIFEGLLETKMLNIDMDFNQHQPVAFNQ